MSRIAIPARTYAAEVLADAPVGFWRLGDASGNPADSSGNGLAATVSGTLVYGVPGPLNGDATKALHLAPASGTVIAPNGPNWLSASFSAEVWMLQHGLKAFSLFVHDRTNGWALVAVDGAGAFRVDAKNQAQSLSAPASLVSNVWNHYVVTFNATPRTLTIYKDGAQVAQSSGVFSADINSAATQNPQLARPTQSGGLGGDVADWAWYTTVLSPARVLAHYLAGLAAARMVVS